jgi:hypothetical protein
VDVEWRARRDHPQPTVCANRAANPLRINEFLLTLPADAAPTIPNRNNQAKSTSLTP